MAEIKKRGDSFVIRISAGYDDNGRQIKKNLTYRPDPGLTEKQLQKELQRQAVLFEERVRTGQYLEGNIRFSSFAAKWMTDHAEKHLAPKTVVRYRELLTRINAAIGHIPLDKLKPNHLLDFYDNLSRSGERQDRKKKATTIFLDGVVASGMKVPTLARSAGISESTVRVALDGHAISIGSAAALSKVLGLKIEEAFIPVQLKPNLSGRTILNHHRLISSILATAVRWQVVSDNVAEHVRAPKADPYDPTILDELQARRIIELLADEPIMQRTMIVLLIYFGMRRGEILGLKWQDIDFEHDVMEIRRTIQFLPGKGLFEKEPKSRKSIRAIKMSGPTVLLLREYRAWQASERLKAGDMWRDLDLLFTRDDGSFFSPDDLTKWFSRFMKRNEDLPKVTLHSLRATNATLQIAHGVNISTVSRRLGHADTNTTLTYYARALHSADEAAAETIEDILDPMKKSDKGTDGVNRR